MSRPSDYAIVVPMANEEKDFFPFINALAVALTNCPAKVYLIVDDASRDKTLELARTLAKKDERFRAVYAPRNRNVVDAYLRGYTEAYNEGHDFIVEMDAGLSHDPAALQHFFDAYQQGYDCVYGSRFIKRGLMRNSSLSRKFLSRGGTLAANLLLGTGLKDMTSGYQGFSRKVVQAFLSYPLRSTAHFYQTELRYLLRNIKHIEIPVTYQAPSPSVSTKAIGNSIKVLLFYFYKRITLSSVLISPAK